MAFVVDGCVDVLDVIVPDLSVAVALAFLLPSVFAPCACQIILADRFLRPAGAQARFRRAGTALVGLFEA